MIVYNFILKLTGHQIKYLLRVCLREYERINSKYYEYEGQKKYELKQIGNIIFQIKEKINEIENDLGVKI